MLSLPSRTRDNPSQQVERQHHAIEIVLGRQFSLQCVPHSVPALLARDCLLVLFVDCIAAAPPDERRMEPIYNYDRLLSIRIL